MGNQSFNNFSEAVRIVLGCGFIATRTTLQGVQTEDNTAERCSGPRIACLQGIMDIRVDAFNWGWERDHAIQNHFVGLKSPLEQRYR